MPSRRRTPGWEVKAVDRINELPESIITEILNLLPTKDAVATSVLSKNWRSRWKEVTTFDIEFSRPLEMKYSPMYDVEAAISAIPPMVRVLRIVDLDSDDNKSNVAIEIPDEIYTCKTLEVMKLDGGIFNVKLPDVVCLPKLAELELNWVRYESDQTIFELIHSCPVLQSLTVKMRVPAGDRTLTVSSLSLKRLRLSCFALPRETCYGKKLVKIDTPKLEYLKLEDSVSNDISVHGLSALKEVEIDVFGPNIRPDSFVGIVESFHGVEFLKLSNFVVSRLAKATRKFSASFDRLTKLVVDFSVGSRSNWLVDLIHQSVNLKVLKMINNGRCSILSPHIVIPGCLSSSLQTLNSTIRLPNKFLDLKMMEFLLRHGLVLKRVDLCFEISCSEGDIDEACQKMDGIVERLLEMPRSSPDCKIISRSTVLCRD